MDEVRYEPVTGSTREVSTADRRDFWTEHVRANHGALDFRFDSSATDFIGNTHVLRLAPYQPTRFQIIDFTSGPVRYVRDAAQLRRDPVCSARLLIPRTGELAVAQSGEAVRLRPGQLGLMSWGRPMRLEHGDGARAWIVTIPEEVLPPKIKDRPPLRLRGHSAMLGTVAAMTKEMTSNRETLTAWEFGQLSSHLIDIVVKALIGETMSQDRQYDEIAAAARALVAACADDPTVTPSYLAERLGCSRRQLERALASQQTSPAALLRAIRLQRARERLTREPYRTVADVAFASGFLSRGAFERAWASEFTESPGRYRRRTRTPGQLER
ncbi:AraC family transcriptional regulator [Nocardia otitidiscaviarum]|uniref:AraC family transcriptional regulator n=1 Tax=Nocardia otitidiscaviarum TaxID=1823 RepID=UPI0018960BC2|nr:helix-turn-helix transcriptional regulator [Nocardia otitidiscaviarum]MBF6237531.1 AraC family transcriptional regulator [Nocardia otitidiscaviarum]